MAIKKKTARRLFILSLCLLALTLLFIYALRRLEPAVRSLAAGRAELALTRLINSEVLEIISEEGLSYISLIETERTSEGRISSLVINAERVNTVKSILTERIAKKAAQIDKDELSVPLGNALGSIITSGRGPDIPVRILSVTSVKSTLENDFSAAGINQTRHRVMLRLELCLTLIYPGGSEKITVTDSVCLAETVIAGEIPHFFATR